MGLTDIEYSKLDPELVMKLTDIESNKPAQQQLLALRDMADMTQELLNVVDSIKAQGSDSQNQFGAVLLDIREQLQAIRDQEQPEMPNYAQPVVKALEKAEKSLSDAFGKLDVKPEFKPNIQVDAPQVNVETPSVDVDLSGVEKILKTELPKAFTQAIANIPKTQIPEQDLTPVVDKLDTVVEWLESIDTTSRLKTQFPNTLKVTNPDGTNIGAENFVQGVDYDFTGFSNPDANGNYQTISYKAGGAGGTTVRTLSLAFDANSNVTSILVS